MRGGGSRINYRKLMLKPHTFAKEITRIESITLTTEDGTRIPLIRSRKGGFACFDYIGDEPKQLILERGEGWQGAEVKPARAGAVSTTNGTRLLLTITQARPLLIELPGDFLISLIIKPPCVEPPEPIEGGRLIRFCGGAVHDADHIQLASHDVLWLDPGAWVRATILATAAKGVIIGGRGVLENPPKATEDQQHHGTIFDHCNNLKMGGIHMLAQHGWMISIGNCDNVMVDSVSQESHNAGTDGVDLVGSRDVVIRHCFLLNSDDNIAIKALDRNPDPQSPMVRRYNFNGDWTGTVQNVLVENCSFYNDHGGSAMEIGYETRTDFIRNIVFRKIDVMAVHRFGSVFGIHTGDRACIENVLWDDIVVEHHYDKLIDFRILHSRWNEDRERGHVTGVTLRNIHVNPSIYNRGYTVSLIGGWDAQHRITDVRFENFRILDTAVLNPDALDLYLKHASDVVFSAC